MDRDALPQARRTDPEDALRGETFYDAVRRKGIGRRTFMKFCAAVAGMLGLEASGAGRIARALEKKKKIPIVWLEFQDCAGNTESFLRADKPSADELILEVISLDYHETLMAAAGDRADALLEKIVKEHKGAYLAVVEGSIPMKDGGVYCCIGGKTALSIARAVCGNAIATIAAGTCASFGGLPAANPNPTGAVSLQVAVPEATVINLSACPFNPANITATLVYYLTYGRFPKLDREGRPLFAYGTRIHDNCERRGHFDAGRYSKRFGGDGHRRGYCLYDLGCKGPTTFQNCPTVRWNQGTNWPIGAGHPCIGCAEPGFWDRSTPFYERLPHIQGAGLDETADRVGLGLVAATAAAFTTHGVVHAFQRGRQPSGKKLPMHQGPGSEKKEG